MRADLSPRRSLSRFALAAALIPLSARAASAAQPAFGDLGAIGAAGAALGAAVRAYVQGPGLQAQAAAASRDVDLTAQWGDLSGRNQQDVGSCHDFGAVAVLEAAYFRRYGRRVRLSEEDLFVRRTVLSGHIYGDFCRSGKCALDEGDDIAGDIRYALDHGVLTGGSYQEFLTRYRRYREAEVLTMEGLQRRRDEQGWLDKLLYDPRAHWKRLQTETSSKRLLRQVLLGRDRDSGSARAKVKAEFAGFRLRTRSFVPIEGPTAAKIGPGGCRMLGGIRRDLLSAELAAGRPVGVSISLSGLAAWGQADPRKKARHAFVLLGYSGKAGERVFHSLNSWGGQNPDVPEDQLCRIYAVNTVLAPGERATF